jgi:riboflavin biosynthesis pyrimidine reductase
LKTENPFNFPPAPADRPYVFINMVATIDGKTILGTRNDPVKGLGSETDQTLMRRLELAADAILIGAGNLRSVPNLWYPKEKLRLVATQSGNLNYQQRFFTDAPYKAFVLGPSQLAIPQPFQKITNDFRQAFQILRTQYGVERLLIEGGSELNGRILPLNLVDELFLTIAPKVKLGDNSPTYAGGEPLPAEHLQLYSLIEHHAAGDELFLRYRRREEL